MNSIDFSDATHAVVKVVVYLDKKPLMISSMKEVKEEAGWRIDSYPFVGWN